MVVVAAGGFETQTQIQTDRRRNKHNTKTKTQAQTGTNQHKNGHTQGGMPRFHCDGTCCHRHRHSVILKCSIIAAILVVRIRKMR